MSTLLEELCARAGGITQREVEHFHRLIAVWQMLGDLAFADLLLLAPLADDPDQNLLALAQIRPLTAQTLYPDDHVGTALLAEYAPEAIRALARAKIQSGRVDSRGVQRAAIPVRVGDRVPAVLVREGMPFGGRRVSNLEEAYSTCGDTLLYMIAEGAFPYEGMETWEPPRVGEGLMVVDALGTITYASPNAVAASRRLGVYRELVGRHLAELTGGGTLWSAIEVGRPQGTEVEIGGEVISRRVVPLRLDGHNEGGIILVQDVTELRRRDRMLMFKDAVIREIHHRVKNNLQTIASLLRLQARRLDSKEAKEALDESVTRIRTIAFVHETLSQASSDFVDFDEVIRGVMRMLEDALGLGDRGIKVDVRGEVGELPAVIATPLSLVMTELVQNAAEHAFIDSGGNISIALERRDGVLHAEVDDDGVGIGEDFSWEGTGLGLQIVQRLVTDELKGDLEMHRDGGTRVEIDVPLPGYPQS
jgi:two-component system, sensor histidine kinase PdtaS